MTQTSSPTGTAKRTRQVALATFVGSAIEWYDFFIYGSAAALVFAPQFFPNFDPLIGLIAAFGTFAAGFIARPIGGLIFGHFGDRLGRKRTLFISLMIMGLGTLLIGLLPNYAQIGILAPIVLIGLRTVQGLGVGGEWGGAVLMATEHAPNHKKSLHASFPQMGQPVGIILANLVFLGALGVLGPDAFAQWGWRLPFVFSAVLVVVALFIRLKLEESPEFEKSQSGSSVEKLPLVTTLRFHWKQLIAGVALTLTPSALGYLFSVYLLSYGVQIGHPQQQLMLFIALASIVYLLFIFLAGRYGDRVNPVRIFMLSMALAVVGVFVAFWLFEAGTALGAFASMVVLAIPLGLSVGVQSILTSRAFPAKTRYTGSSLSYQVGAVLGGGLAPTIATALNAATGGSLGTSLYMVGLCVLSSLGALALGKLHRTPVAEFVVKPEAESGRSAVV